jgi:hypothetical protein
MTPKIKFALILLPLAFIILSILEYSGNLNENTGVVVVLISALIGIVFDIVNRINKEN